MFFNFCSKINSEYFITGKKIFNLLTIMERIAFECLQKKELSSRMQWKNILSVDHYVNLVDAQCKAVHKFMNTAKYSPITIFT